MKNKNIKIISLSVLAILIIMLGVTYAFFIAGIGPGASTDINIESKTSDRITFDSGSPLNLTITQETLGVDSGDVSGSTTSNVKLVANNNTNNATMTYNVYFDITENTFEYTTDSNDPEMILTITDPSGTILNTLSGLSYVTVGSVSGFDITEYSGLIRISENQEISTTSSTTGTTQSWTATITFINLETDQADNEGKNLKAGFKIQKEEIPIPTLAETILANNGGAATIAAKGSPNFATTATTNEGMYAMTDDYGTSYYFRGAVDNNWVKFANMYWRIVRVNGNNSVKLIYSGTTAPTEAQKAVMTGTGTQINGATLAFNSSYNTAEYVGYMYTVGQQRGTGTSSPIKTYIESWYASNLASYDNKIADTIFCNDRSTYSGTVGGTNFTGNGVGTTETWFGAARRLINASSWAPIGTGPSIVCPHKDDAFTKADATKGNGKLSQKVGLLTADEVAIAGGAAGSANSNYYLYTNSNYWLGSPCDYYIYNAREFFVDSSGLLDSYGVNASLGARAVVSLSSNISSSTGNGTWNNPYVIN